MKQDKKKYLYICDNCDHEFYLKYVISNFLVGCARCGKKTAYCEVDFLEDNVDIDDCVDSDIDDCVDSDIDDCVDSDFIDFDFLTDSKYEDHYDYSEY
ncbi:hypothetical protein ACFL1R_07800 [Candidatus Latescibacterota bacterium]